MRVLRRKPRVRPSHPSLSRQWLGVLVSVVAVLVLDVMFANGYKFSGSGNLYLVLVIFVTFWAGLWSGLASAAIVTGYVFVAPQIQGSALYQIDRVNERAIAAGVILGFFAALIGVIQGKLRNARIREWDAETRLQQSEELRASVVDASMDAIVVIDAEGVITLWSKSAEELFGWTASEVIGKRLSETIVPPEYREQHEQGLKNLRDGGPGRIFGTRLELAALRKDGKEFAVELSVVPHRSEGVTVYVGFLRDITMQRRIQHELISTQKLESVGQLAGGVAHDFNNVLSVIVGVAELAKRKLMPGDPVQEDLDQILEAATKSAQINAQLLAFARKQVTTPKVVSLNEVVNGIRPMFSSLIAEHIELTFSLDPELWDVKVDPGQIEQVLTNLAINARDAMPNGGKLMFETRNVSVEPDDELPVPDILPGDYATLSVTDTGIGIAPENLERVFEPFFTTKADKGTGLGLASSYGIVKKAGGRIGVYSEPGHGTMFRVYLPRTLESLVAAAQRTERPAVARGTETILVAEDNAQVRAVVAQSLRLFGYTVLVAESGEEALHVAGAHGVAIDMLVTDLIMPRMGGVELASRLRAEIPDLRVLFLSGYTEEAVTEKGVSGVEGAFLQKPVLPTELGAKVRELLDAPSRVS
jgi:two-component system cell cycle sensor histidine kinase/response regulator CckA